MRATRTRVLLAAFGLAPALSAALLVRPAVGQQPVFGLYALTATTGAVTLDGDLGAGGGLAVIDGGVPFVTGRVDSAPSASVRSAAIEPGTLVRTVAGVVNTEAGEIVLDIPQAESSYPGGAEEGNADLLGSESAGPITMSGLTARTSADVGGFSGEGVAGSMVVRADEGASQARAEALRAAMTGLAAAFPTVFAAPSTSPSSGVDAGAAAAAEDDPEAGALVVIEGGRATATATADGVAGTLHADARSTVARVAVLGELAFENVVGRAVVDVAGLVHQAEASVSVASVSLGGVPFRVSSDGLVVAGEVVVPGGDIAGFNEQVNAALAEAGIGVQALAPVEVVEGRSARADSRGIRILLTTPPLASGGVPGNDLTIILGAAAVSASDEAPYVFTPIPVATTEPAPTSTPTPIATPTASPPPVPTSQPTIAPPTLPEVSPPPVAEPAPPLIMIAGRPVDARTALAAFGLWQVLSLTTVAMAAVQFGGAGPDLPSRRRSA